MGEGVAHRAVHLRHAAQRIGILHPRAVTMRLANAAAFEHLAQVLGGFYLPGVWTSFVNTVVEGHIGATQGVEGHGSNHVGGVHQRFCGE